MLGSSRNNTKRLLILGNGFDVDLGMKSRYSDFAKSKIWEDEIEGDLNAKMRNGLLKTLVEAKNHDNWFDIEQTMMDYVRDLQDLAESTNYDYDAYEGDEKEYLKICDSLKKYLQQESESFQAKGTSIVEEVMKLLLLKGNVRKIYTFNYTSVHDIIRKKLCIDGINPEVIHVHGSLTPPDNIILGVEGGNIIPEPYKFLYKTSSRYYHSNNLYEDLHSANEVIFFGHSINGMDFEYFHNFFLTQANVNGDYRRKYIRIFTGDTSSMQDIKYNLRANGIDIARLYLYNNFDFIQCIDWENNDELEKKKFNQFEKDIAILGEGISTMPL